MATSSESAPTASPRIEDRNTEKARRINLINRRTVALLIDSMVYGFTIGPPLGVLVGKLIAPTPIILWMVAVAPFWLLRDAIGPASFGKQLVQLGLRSASGSGAPSLGPRIIRGIISVLPLGPLIEFFAAYFGNERMQRFGDVIAETYVIDLDPKRWGKGMWSAQLLTSLLLSVLAFLVVGPTVLGFWTDAIGR